MEIKITFENTSTKEVLSDYTLSEEQVKALETVMVDIPKWVRKAIELRVRQSVNRIVELSNIC